MLKRFIENFAIENYNLVVYIVEYLNNGTNLQDTEYWHTFQCPMNTKHK